jgi:hypothetical protein
VRISAFFVLIGFLAVCLPRTLRADPVPLFEYYETSKTKVSPIDEKYHEVDAEAITITANLLAPIYRNDQMGSIFNFSLINIVRSETVANVDVAPDQQYFKYLSVFKVGLINYVKLNDTFTPIFMVNYFNHPSAAKAFRPMYDTYLGTTLWKNYTLLLRVVHHPHGTTYSPLAGWAGSINETLSVDILLPASGKIMYTPLHKRWTWTNGFQGESRDFPSIVDSEKGWLTGYHVRLYSQFSHVIWRALQGTLTTGGIYSANRFYPYEAPGPTKAFIEKFTPFMGIGLEANL